MQCFFVVLTGNIKASQSKYSGQVEPVQAKQQSAQSCIVVMCLQLTLLAVELKFV